MSIPNSALAGIKVIDLTTVIFGPYASLILADYGAEVIKVEPLTGDSTRYTGPHHESDLSAVFLGANRNKKSIALNLKEEKAQEIFHQLIKQADVVMHNIRPQKLAKLGLDPETLCKLNPRLIYASLLGFGNNGAYSGKPAYDDLIQALSGIVDTVNQHTGEPRYYPTIVADKTSGHVAAHAILAALFQRERSGQGQVVEIPMFESIASYTLVEHFYGLHIPETQTLPGYERLLSKFRKPYATQDGYIAMTPYTDRHWAEFFIAAGQAHYKDDPRFQDISARTQNINDLYALLEENLQHKTTAEWMTICEQAQIPAAPINKLEDLPNDPHLKSVNFFKTLEHKGHQYRFSRNPVTFEQSKVEIKMPPHLGQHTYEILSSLGYSNAEIQSFNQANLIKTYSN